MLELGEVLAENAEAPARELLNAGVGTETTHGDYAGELKPRDGMHAVIKALESGIGHCARPGHEQEHWRLAGHRGSCHLRGGTPSDGGPSQVPTWSPSW